MKKTVTALIAAFLATLIALPLDTAFAGRGGKGGGGRGGGHIGAKHGGGHVGRIGGHRGYAHRGYRGHYKGHGYKYSYKNYHGKYRSYRYGRSYGWGYWPGIYAGSSYGYRRCYSPVYGWVPCRYRYYGYSY